MSIQQSIILTKLFLNYLPHNSVLVTYKQSMIISKQEIKINIEQMNKSVAKSLLWCMKHDDQPSSFGTLYALLSLQ